MLFLICHFFNSKVLTDDETSNNRVQIFRENFKEIDPKIFYLQ